LSASPLTIGLAVLMIAIFVAEAANAPGYNVFIGTGRLPPLIIDYGVVPSAINAGQYWRLVTAGFLHASVIHVALNTFSLVYAGRYLEPRLGMLRFAAVFLVSVVLGDVAAYLTSGPRTVTVGASGGIMGLFGAMGLIAWRFWSERDQLQTAAVLLTANLLNGFFHAGISNAGHVGGLIGGLLTAFAVGADPAWAATTREAQNAAIERSRAEHAATMEARPVDAGSTEPLLLRTTIRRRVGFLITGGVFSLAGIWAFTTGVREWWVYAVVIGGALGAIGPFMVQLELTPEGFTQRSLMVKKLVRWTDIEPGLGVSKFSYGYASQSYVTFRYRPATFGHGGAPGEQRVIAWFGVKPEKQAALMEEWRRRWTTISSP